ncbi:MAG TPA: DUF1549 domain-containing protein [Planctomycetota bacterium]
MIVLFALLVQAHPLDALFQDEWKRLELKPAAPADDATFLRRVTLDLTGVLPEPDDVRAFLKSTKKSKRTEKIDALLASPQAAEYFAQLWVQWLMGHDIQAGDLNDDFSALVRKLKAAWEKDLPYDDLVRSLLADPAYLGKHLAEPPAAIAGQTARLFLGVDLRCAQCHDHPFQKISQADFWGFAAFFGTSKGAVREDLGELRVEPRFLDGRTGKLADLLLSGDAAKKAVVERYWTLFFGRKGAPDVPFTGSLRGLVRLIATSAAYQRSSEGPDAARRAYAAGPLKMMNSVQFMKVWNHAFQFDAYYRAMYAKDPAKAPFFRDPELFWIGQTMAAKELLFPKGRDPEEAMAAGTDRLALKLMNNRDLQLIMVAKFSQTGQYGHVWRVMKQTADPGRRLDELFLLMVSRPPTSSERAWMLRHLKEAANPFHATSDVFWTLFNSSEFIFIG